MFSILSDSAKPKQLAFAALGMLPLLRDAMMRGVVLTGAEANARDSLCRLHLHSVTYAYDIYITCIIYYICILLVLEVVAQEPFAGSRRYALWESRAAPLLRCPELSAAHPQLHEAGTLRLDGPSFLCDCQAWAPRTCR
eukprot:SAG31_NODE_1367_length_8615_cov_12.875763_3_plen_139_part_00